MVPVMIGRDYFKLQAKTLRKMVKVAQDPVVADRLCELADEFESRAGVGSDEFEHQLYSPDGARGDEVGVGWLAPEETLRPCAQAGTRGARTPKPRPRRCSRASERPRGEGGGV